MVAAMSSADDRDNPTTEPILASPARGDPSGTAEPPVAEEIVDAPSPAAERRGPLPVDVRGLATIGIVVAVLAVIGILVRDRLTIGAYDIRVGDCIDEPKADAIAVALEHHPCSEPHEAEVVFVGDYPAFIVAPYPSEDQFIDFVLNACVPAFEAYTGVAFEDASELDVAWLFPLEVGWRRGDREVACYLYRFDGATIIGSLRAGG